MPAVTQSPAVSPDGCLAVIPARNEAATVGAVVAGVRRVLGCPVVVVDDASTDATATTAAAAGAIVLRLPLPLGAWGAAQAGIRYACRHGFSMVVTLDADGQHQPACLPALLSALQASDVNVMIGTCEERLSRAKRLAWWYLRLLTRLELRDFTSGLRLYDARAMQLLAGETASLLDYQDVGVLMLLARNGLRVAETPAPMLPRRVGQSRVFASWLVVARYMLHTTVLCIARAPRRPSNGASALC